jgi:protein TonB
MVIVFIIIALLLVSPADAVAKTYEVGTESEAEFVEAKPTFNPQPEIPTSAREECMRASCVARFWIDPEGKTKVKLLTHSGSNEIDDITLATLRRWKFKPAMLDGKPVESTRRIKVEFEVQ